MAANGDITPGVVQARNVSIVGPSEMSKVSRFVMNAPCTNAHRGYRKTLVWCTHRPETSPNDRNARGWQPHTTISEYNDSVGNAKNK